jgi:hypothetical protein
MYTIYLFLASFLHKVFALIITNLNTLSFRYFVQGYDAKDGNSLSPRAEAVEKRDTALTNLTNLLLFRQITIVCLGLALCIPLNSTFVVDDCTRFCDFKPMIDPEALTDDNNHELQYTSTFLTPPCKVLGFSLICIIIVSPVSRYEW